MDRIKPPYIIIASCIIIFILGWKGCAVERAKNQLAKEYNKLFTNSVLEIKRYKDDSGRVHNRAEVLVIDNLILEQQVAEQARLLNIKPKQIKGDVEYISDGTVIKQVDTVYKDGWVEIRRLPNDTIKVHLIDTLNVTRYWKRTWFLAHKKEYIDITNRSPYVTITPLRAIEGKSKTPKFIIGPYVGVDYRKQPSFGIGILYYPTTIKF